LLTAIRLFIYISAINYTNLTVCQKDIVEVKIIVI